jgi:hypothetical protein
MFKITPKSSRLLVFTSIGQFSFFFKRKNELVGKGPGLGYMALDHMWSLD